MVKRPSFTRSIRFRLTLLYSLLLFALTGLTLGITYWAVAATTQPEPLKEITVKVYRGHTLVAQIPAGRLGRPIKCAERMAWRRSDL